MGRFFALFWKNVLKIFPCQIPIFILKLTQKWGEVVAKYHKVEEKGFPGRQVVIVMFMGEYNHTLDVKGRLIIPSKFRDTLGESFIVARGMDGCLFVYSNDAWNDIHMKIKELPSLTNKESRHFSRFLLAGASEVDVDKQGRILVPQNLREFAGLDKDVVLVGVGDRIEIWNKEKWDDINLADNMDEIAAAMERLGLSI